MTTRRGVEGRKGVQRPRDLASPCAWPPADGGDQSLEGDGGAQQRRQSGCRTVLEEAGHCMPQVMGAAVRTKYST